MKRTWVVYVEQGVGHELHNTIDAADWYGPFTETQARRLETALNQIFDGDTDIEHPIASAMPLMELSPRDVVRRAKEEAKNE